jgi:hypothetical protein
MMDEQAIRAIVRDELQNELLREGGLTDHCRVASLNALIEIMKIQERTIRSELRDELRAELGLVRSPS